MQSFLRTTWLRFCSLINVSRTHQNSLREKAILVAGRVNVTKDGNIAKICCPVCLESIQGSLDSDLKMNLAVHMSIWHMEDVNIQWQILQNQKNPLLYPFFGIGTGFVILWGIKRLQADKR